MKHWKCCNCWWNINGLLDWLNGESNMISNASQSNFVLYSFIVIIIQFSPLFNIQIHSYTKKHNSNPDSISMVVLYCKIYLSIYLSIKQWIYKCELSPSIIRFEPFHCVTIKSHLLVYGMQPISYHYLANSSLNPFKLSFGYYR